jgi:hypothetical protein
MNVYNDHLHNAKTGINSDAFWFDDYRLLLDKSRIAEFYPSFDMTMIEKLNALMRLSIYVGVLLFFLKNNYQYLAIPLLVGLFTMFIYKTQMENMEMFFTSYDSVTNRQNQEVLTQNREPKTHPTVNNPFMNYIHGVPAENTQKPPAVKSYNNDLVKHEIESKFNKNLYRNVDDIYNKSHGQLVFNTVPVTTVTNDQTAYANWLYRTGPTLKEDTTKGAPNWNPVDHLEPDNTC